MELDISNSLDSLAVSVPKKNFNSHPLNPMTASLPSPFFEIRLFYVRVSPCFAVDSVPALLTLSYLRREVAAALEINGSRLPPSETTASLSLRRDRIDRDASEVTYVSTDSVRVAGPVEFEVYEADVLILCGSLERVEPLWKNGGAGFDRDHHEGLDTDSKTGWCMDCFSAASLTTGSSTFFQPNLGPASPSIEVYVAGCCSGFPIILTKGIHLSPRSKPVRHATHLDSIPEDEETVREHRSIKGFSPPRVSEVGGNDDYNSDWKIGHDFYSEGRFSDDEDGQLTWFNAGVRVGVGIGLGMCLGIGIGVGLLMRSYQATTRTFKRKFL